MQRKPIFGHKPKEDARTKLLRELNEALKYRDVQSENGRSQSEPPPEKHR
jgi:hypothetical protein